MEIFFAMEIITDPVEQTSSAEKDCMMQLKALEKARKGTLSQDYFVKLP